MFNFTDAEDVSNVVPAGTYQLRVESAELKESKTGNKMIKVVYVVMGTVTKDGVTSAQSGRKIFQNYMMSGNEKAVSIARSNIKSLLKAGNKPLEIQDVSDLVDIEIDAAVKVTPAKGEYSEGNAVGAFKPKSAAAAGSIPF